MQKPLGDILHQTCKYVQGVFDKKDEEEMKRFAKNTKLDVVSRAATERHKHPVEIRGGGGDTSLTV